MSISKDKYITRVRNKASGLVMWGFILFILNLAGFAFGVPQIMCLRFDFAIWAAILLAALLIISDIWLIAAIIKFVRQRS